MSYSQCVYHFIFRTKYSRPAIEIVHEKEFYNYVWGTLTNMKSHLYRIGGMPDHVHILASVPTTIAVADLMRDLKTQSHKWILEKGLFSEFAGWAEGYAALTYSLRDREMISDYIKGQKEHHQKEDFKTEFRRILVENGISINEQWFLKD